ncbi:hypothetical protein L7F22_038358 [Adiantum nelumboides]|nr:hypothetical protein [Adiantum nelumboides]
MGTLVTDDLWMTGHGSAAVEVGHRVVFGCSTTNRVPFTGPAGVLALGRNSAYSLQNQLQTRMNLPDNTFSYCLSYENQATLGLLTLGGPTPAGTVFTPLGSNPHPTLQNLYYVTLLGISMGGGLLPIPPYVFGINPDTGMGGVVLATVDHQTTLPDFAYDVLRQAVVAALTDLPYEQRKLEVVGSNNLPEVDLCFRPLRHRRIKLEFVHEVARLFEGIPPITFHFAGGASLEIPWINLLPMVNRDLEPPTPGLHSTRHERRLCMVGELCRRFACSLRGGQERDVHSAPCGRAGPLTDVDCKDVVGKGSGSEKLDPPWEGGVQQLCLRHVDVVVTPPVFLKTRERLTLPPPSGRKMVANCGLSRFVFSVSSSGMLRFLSQGVRHGGTGGIVLMWGTFLSASCKTTEGVEASCSANFKMEEVLCW